MYRLQNGEYTARKSEIKKQSIFTVDDKALNSSHQFRHYLAENACVSCQCTYHCILFLDMISWRFMIYFSTIHEILWHAFRPLPGSVIIVFSWFCWNIQIVWRRIIRIFGYGNTLSLLRSERTFSRAWTKWVV